MSRGGEGGANGGAVPLAAVRKPQPDRHMHVVICVAPGGFVP
jgi:hypothetical protein